MPSDRRPDRALLLGLAGIAVVTLWRVALLPFDQADLFVDDAQYWLWSRELAWGYFSKPPLIAWILRASTAIGSDAPFWIRVPLPLIHAATAVVVALIGRRLWDGRIGGLAGLAFVSLPGVAVGSLLVSTDTPMLLCFALALLAHLRLAQRPSAGWAFVLGAAVGVGLLAKYAMVYFVLCAAVAAVRMPAARLARRDAVLAAAVALAVVAPNIAWNVANGFATVRHTADNAGWQGPLLQPLAFAEFAAGQFAVAGPVIFAAYLASVARAVAEPRLGWLAAFSLPVFAVVSVQALLAGANANWAAAGHVAASIAAIAALAARPRLLAAGLAVNLAVTLALPVMSARASSLRLPGGELAFVRYLGRADMSRRIAAAAQAEGLDTVVAESRDVLADLFYTLRDGGIAIHAAPADGSPPNHYAQRHALPSGFEGDVLFVGRAGGPGCPEAVEVARWRPGEGYTTRETVAFRVPGSCWAEPGRAASGGGGR